VTKILTMFKIIIDLESLDMMASRAYGIIYLQIGEVFFPAPRWRDFVLSVMNDWLALVKQDSKEYKLFFYDANAFVKVTRFGSLSLVRDGIVAGSFEVDALKMREEIIDVATRLSTHLGKLSVGLGPADLREYNQLKKRLTGGF
jgi:hypothetical protein